MDAKTFVKNHEHVCYCEAIVLPNGEVEYANPSHTSKLYTLEGVRDPLWCYMDTQEYKELSERIPIDASPLMWMCEDLNVICTWYDVIAAPMHYTKEQLSALRVLIDERCISGFATLKIAYEKSHCEILQSDNPSDVHRLMQKARMVRTDLQMRLGLLDFKEGIYVPFGI